MKRTIILLTILTAAAVMAISACSGNVKAGTGEIIISQDSLIRRGSYLVNAIGCDDCHSPKKMGAHGPEVDLEHRFAGHLASAPVGKADLTVFKEGWMLFSMDLTAGVGPWGISYAANISSDETGIGNWSEAQFIKSLRQGKSKGMDEGRPLLPPMPWQNFAKLNDLDLKAMFAFLKSTKPIQNVVPGPQPLGELK